MTPDDPHARPGETTSEEQAIAAFLAAHRPAPSAAMRERGRRTVKRALHDRALRRQAVGLGIAGWLALALALVMVIMGA